MNAALRAPFPYFGGKRRVAARVWEALGNVEHYVEPFCGSAAVLLGRPHVARCETINDADGMVANFWRAVAADPDAVARHVDWPVNEADLHARHRWLIGQRVSLTERLIENPWWFDAQVAGWWCWGACAWIGDGWCANTTRKLIHLGNEGRGVNAPSRQLIHVGNEGMGVHAPRRGAGVADDDAGVVDVREWMRRLQARLRPVRVACGDWHRVVASPTTLFPAGRGQSSYRCGVFLDAPYSEGAADYAVGGTGTALQARVQAWALEHGDDPRLRIVVAGYEGEHEALQRAGWRVEGWKTKGGYASQNEDGNANQRRERLWLSPHCEGGKQRSLFDALGGSR
jgi:hypothetical protein